MMDADRATYLKKRYRGSQSVLNYREQRFVDSMLAQVAEPLEEVIDVPCGHGRFTPQLRQAATRRLVCADLRLEHIKALVGAEGTIGTPIETAQVDLYQRLPFADEEFDLVFNFRFFHHIRDAGHREHVISELARISARYLIVSYYADSVVHALQKRLWRHAGHSRDLPMIGVPEFRRCFGEYGCEVVEDRAVLPGIHAHHIALIRRT
jgi:hypothetical protein